MQKADSLIQMRSVNSRNGFRIKKCISKRNQRINRVIGRALHSFVHYKIFGEKVFKIRIKPCPGFTLNRHYFCYCLRGIHTLVKFFPNPVGRRFNLFFIMLVIMVEDFINVITNSMYNGFRNVRSLIFKRLHLFYQ